MHLITLIVLFFFLVGMIFMTVYGYLNVREIKLAKNDLGLTLPKKVGTLVNISLVISFLSVVVLFFLLLLEFAYPMK